jgi:hypothetical protein
MPLDFILTNAGKAAIVAANNAGTSPVTISEIAIGDAAWTPSAISTGLTNQIKRLTAIGGGAVADDTIHVTGSDSSSDIYTVREVGLYLSSGVLLAIYSQADPIITKGAATVALIAADLVITGLPAGLITVGGTNFEYPPATQTARGVVELATDEEARAGIDAERAMTPSNLSAIKLAIFDVLYPVGEMLITRRAGNPATWLGFGVWTRYAKGRTIVSLDEADPEFAQIDQAGGAKTHTLTVNEMPLHDHGLDNVLRYPATTTMPAVAEQNQGGGPESHSAYSPKTEGVGGGLPHNNLQPYIAVMMWTRTA